MDIWELLEKAPDGCEDVADLYHWSTNFGCSKGPFTLFLDLIGWTEDEMGEGQVLYDLPNANLGYIELSKLADALKEYSDRPSDVRAFVEQIMRAEMGDDEDEE